MVVFPPMTCTNNPPQRLGADRTTSNRWVSIKTQHTQEEQTTMNRKLATIGALALTVMFTGLAASHELSYVQAQPGKPNPSTGVGVSGTDCGIGNHIVLNLSIGGVCFGSTPDQGWDNGNAGFTDPVTGLPAGSTDLQHLTPAGAESTSTIDITDSTFALTPATYCQSLGPDTLCGGNLTGDAETEPGGNPAAVCQAPHREGSTGCLFRSEPYVDFCDTVTIFAGLSGELPAGSRRIGGVAPGVAGSGDWADPTLDNWDVDVEVLIFVSAPASGNTVFGSACGSNGWATQGTVSHT